MTVVNISDAPKASKREKLDKYCEGIANGLSRTDAYITAGYSEVGARANASAYHKANIDYINAYIADHIGSHVPTALKVLLEIMNSQNEKGGIRLKAAQDILDRAGFGAKQKIELTHKDVDEMSTGELEDEIKRILSEDAKLAEIFSSKEQSSN